MDSGPEWAAGQRLAHQRQEPPDVVPGGELGHHPAIGLVQRDLAVKPMGQQPPRGVVDGHGGLVAGALDSDDAHESGQNACQLAYNNSERRLCRRLCLLRGAL